MCATSTTRQARTGTLWEGRYRSTLIQAERYLLACMVYIDLNPVRAGIVPARSRLSLVQPSATTSALRADRLVTPHPLYWALGNTPFAREQAYAELVAPASRPRSQELLTTSTFRGWARGRPGLPGPSWRMRRRAGQRRRRGAGRARCRAINLSPIITASGAVPLD